MKIDGRRHSRMQQMLLQNSKRKMKGQSELKRTILTYFTVYNKYIKLNPKEIVQLTLPPKISAYPPHPNYTVL